MRPIWFGLALAALTTSTTSHAASWLCLADKSTGFYYDAVRKSWEETSFKVTGARYIIRKPESGTATWEVQQFGEINPIIPYAWCQDDFSEAGFLNCRGMLVDFRMNRHNGRYMLNFGGQYLAYNPSSEIPAFRRDGGDTPFIEIGTCSQI